MRKRLAMAAPLTLAAAALGCASNPPKPSNPVEPPPQAQAPQKQSPRAQSAGGAAANDGQQRAATGTGQQQSAAGAQRQAGDQATATSKGAVASPAAAQPSETPIDQSAAASAAGAGAPSRQGQAPNGQTGIQAKAGVPREAAAGASAGATEVAGAPAAMSGGYGAQTSEERSAAAAAALERSVAQFDQRLDREQTQIAALQQATRQANAGRAGNAGAMAGGTGGMAGGEAGLARLPPPLPPGGTGLPEGQRGDDPASGERRGGGFGQPAEVIAARTPDDIGSGEDDDVVARQLREAALAEEDPELRAKLWEEYRRYKASQ